MEFPPVFADLQARLAAFPTIEVACAEDRPHANLPYATLMTAPVTLNPGYVAQ